MHSPAQTGPKIVINFLPTKLPSMHQQMWGISIAVPLPDHPKRQSAPESAHRKTRRGGLGTLAILAILGILAIL